MQDSQNTQNTAQFSEDDIFAGRPGTEAAERSLKLPCHGEGSVNIPAKEYRELIKDNALMGAEIRALQSSILKHKADVSREREKQEALTDEIYGLRCKLGILEMWFKAETYHADCFARWQKERNEEKPAADEGSSE